jgi:hypothetical protein
MNGRTNPVRVTPKKKKRGHALHPSFMRGSAWERVRHSFGVQFGVHVARGEPCMCVTMERGFLLRPLLVGPAGQAPSRMCPGPQASPCRACPLLPSV